MQAKLNQDKVYVSVSVKTENDQFSAQLNPNYPSPVLQNSQNCELECFKYNTQS